MNSNNTNHFGNPLVTGIVGNGGNSSSSKQQYYNTNNNASLQSPSTPRRSQQHCQLPTIVSPIQQHSRLTPSTTSHHSTNQTRRNSLPFYVPSGSNRSSTSSLLSESAPEPLQYRHSHSHSHRHGKSFSYDSSSSSSIGVPSMYPGSQHHRNNTFESFLLEELEDFDEIFGSSRSVPQPNNHHI